MSDAMTAAPKRATIRRDGGTGGGRVATVGIEVMSFHRPVYVGDRVSRHCRTGRLGRTSITVHVEAWVRCVRARPIGRRSTRLPTPALLADSRILTHTESFRILRCIAESERGKLKP